MYLVSGIDICKNDLNMDSAATDTVLVNKPYVSLSYAWDGDSVDWLLGMGGSYEYSSNTSALNKWSLWAKLGLCF